MYMIPQAFELQKDYKKLEKLPFGEFYKENEFLNFIAELPEPLLKFFFNDYRELRMQYLNRCNPTTIKREVREECRESQAVLRR